MRRVGLIGVIGIAIYVIGALFALASQDLPIELRLRARIADLEHRVAELEVNLSLALIDRDTLRAQMQVMDAARLQSDTLTAERRILSENLVFASGGDPRIDKWNWTTMTLIKVGGR